MTDRDRVSLFLDLLDATGSGYLDDSDAESIVIDGRWTAEEIDAAIIAASSQPQQ